MMRVGWAFLVWVVMSSCTPSRAPRDAGAPSPLDVETLLRSRRASWTDEERSAAIAVGTEVMTRLDCTRCHTIDAMAPAARPAHCVSCHHFLDGLPKEDRRYRTLASRYGEDVMARYQRNIEHYLEVPGLDRIGARLRIDWLEAYVRNPHDLRPSMDETMVRVRVSDDDAHAIARYFAAVTERPYPPHAPRESSPRATHASLARGEALFRARGCTTCHTFGNLPTGRSESDLRAVGMPARLAPNLRFVRERMEREVAVAFVLDPARLHPGTRMPDLGLSEDEARAVVDFLFEGDPRLEPVPEAPSLALPAALDRRVTWSEVKERVLGKVCVHCHMNDDERDPGPGNVGGFGYPAAHLRMRTYETLVSGAGPAGARRNILLDGGTHAPSAILDRMLRRRTETLRDLVLPFHDHPIPTLPPDDPPGMPMGLPPMTDDELAILRTWIEQGCEGPTRASGMPGIRDGYLVPDGPIVPARGCAVREPAAARPAWSTAPPPPWADDAPRDAGTSR